MRARMEHEKRQLKLIGADQFLGERAKGVRVKLRVGRREIDQVIRVRENRGELGPLRMIEERLDLVRRERPREPLHVVLHENLHRRALDRTRALDRAMHAAADRDVRAEQKCAVRARAI